MIINMNPASIMLTILGLSLFEVISSVDNAIINAEVLSTMSRRAKRWFLIWGLLFAVFVVRGLLPWLIVYAATPALGFWGSFTATFSNDPRVLEAIERSAPVLLAGGGTFLIFLFLHWLFIEPKNYGLFGEKFFHSKSVWFYAAASIALSLIVWFSIKQNPVMAFGTVIGSTAFFITNGFKETAEQDEKELVEKKMSDFSKVLYLEIIDATFSIDGVLGAFAFTLAVPLIILGNGLGALTLRQLTLGNVERIKKYAYLKNGAMYSIFFLGLVMLMEAFGLHVRSWVSPLITFAVVGYFFLKSRAELKLSLD